MTYGKIFGNQGVRGNLVPRRASLVYNNFVYPELWLNRWQAREKKTAAEIAKIIGVPEEEVRRALLARSAPHHWKKAIGAWHRKRRRLRDLYNARERAKRRNA